MMFEEVFLKIAPYFSKTPNHRIAFSPPGRPAFAFMSFYPLQVDKNS
jgi:hypothetical protein